MAMTDKELLAFLQQVNAEQTGAPPAEPEPSEEPVKPAPKPETVKRNPPAKRTKPKKQTKPAKRDEPEKHTEPEKRTEPEKHPEPEKHIEPEKRTEPKKHSKPKKQKKPEQSPAPVQHAKPEIPPQTETPVSEPVGSADLDAMIDSLDSDDFDGDDFFTTATPQHGRLFEVLDAQEQPAPESAAAVRDTRLRDAVIGLILVIFAAIGVCTLVQKGAAYFRNANSDDAQTAAWTQCILPLTVMDAPAFSSPDDMSDEQFLTAAVWCLITDGSLAAYETDTDLRTVPAADVIAAGNMRFGTDRSPVCSTIAFTGELRFYYDADQKCFLLPADPKYFGYLPKIESYTAENGAYKITAAYRPEQPSWYQTEGSVVKRMTYTLTESGGFWQIKALEANS